MVHKDKNKPKSKIRGLVSQSGFVILAILALAGPYLYSRPVHADQYDEKIKQLQSQVANDQQSVDTLQNKANDLGAQVSTLQNQIASAQSQIDLNQKQYNDLSNQIKVAEAELAKQKDILGKNLKAMYIEGKVTPVEMLASSKNLSEYLDKERYRNTVKDKVTETVKKIADLKKELNENRDKVAKLLEDQKKLRDDLAGKQAQANALLAQTNADKNLFQQTINQRQDEITKLRAEQAAANRRFGGVANYVPGAGGYPAVWANAPKDSMVDNWGMFNRECVSYVAWKVSSTGRSMPYWGGRGNANQWPSNARASGIAVDSRPQVGDVAIGYWGPDGHAMYVERVMGGQIYVSQYNYEVQGLYSEMTVSSSGLEFIHF